MRKDSVKNIRINEEVKKELSEIIRSEVKDPRIAPWTSVIEAVVAPDLKTCKVYISVLGDEDKAKETLKGLKSSAGFIRRELAHRVNLRNTPELFFYLDTSIAYGAKMDKLINEVIAHDEENKSPLDEEDE